MTIPRTGDLRDLARTLQQVAGHLTDHGRESFQLAEQWAGELAATAATDGSRSTAHNDLSSRVVNPRANDDTPQRRAFRPEAKYATAYDRMTADLASLRPIIARLAADLDYCQRAVAAERAEKNQLDRVNSKTGECEACYQAGREDSFQRGTLEAVTISGRLTVSRDVDVTHEQFDLCRKCAKAAHGSRAAASSSGQQWDHDAWMTARVAHLERTTGDSE